MIVRKTNCDTIKKYANGRVRGRVACLRWALTNNGQHKTKPKHHKSRMDKHLSNDKMKDTITWW